MEQSSYHEINRCRVGGAADLVSVLNLGQLALTGIFPNCRGDSVGHGPLELVFSPSSGLLQLRHSYDSNQMYGRTYGYRSNLNASMVRHLRSKADFLQCRYLKDRQNARVVDIGSNDATFLNNFPANHKRCGVDPTAEKYIDIYEGNDIEVVTEFFSESVLPDEIRESGADLIASIAMFYDLEDPISFARQVERSLAPGGVWHFEQSYCPSMLRTTGYDTICHEHIEYYSLTVIINILNRAGLKIIDLEFNDVNGGSFAVTAARESDPRCMDPVILQHYLLQERNQGLHEAEVYVEFANQVNLHRSQLSDLITNIRVSGKRIAALGASTKGNVLLQYCSLDSDSIECIGEVNEDKYSCVTPGTNIPIRPEELVLQSMPDYLLILPWHFRNGFVERLKSYRQGGGKLIFPLPTIEIL